MKVLELFDAHIKNMFNIKKIQLPSGKIISVQGYEPYAINWYLENGYAEEDLIIENKDIENHIGKIKYNHHIKAKDSRYYPDFYIKSENCIIEVKSEYTYKQNKEINELKKSACLNLGFNFKFMIFTSIKDDNIDFYWL